jgi:hypothetical protein
MIHNRHIGLSKKEYVKIARGVYFSFRNFSLSSFRSSGLN